MEIVAVSIAVVSLVISLTLLYFKVKEYFKKKVKLEIQIKQKEFTSNVIHDYEETDKTEIVILADIKNKGLEPTTISSVSFSSSWFTLKNIEMNNHFHHGGDFQNYWQFLPIRLEPNDRRTVELSLSENVLLPEQIKKLNSILTFKTPHKDIEKKITLEREDT